LVIFGCELTGCGWEWKAEQVNEKNKIGIVSGNSKVAINSGDGAPKPEFGRVVEEETCRDQH